MIEFTKVKLTDKALFNRFTSNYINSESSFANIMMWNNQYNAEYAIFDNALIMKYCHPDGSVAFSMPYTDGADLISPTLALLEYCKYNNIECKTVDGNKKFIDAISQCDKINIEYNQIRDYQEYVYLSDSLANLSGKDLHSKKNHVNKFKSLYNYKYINIDKSIIPMCIEKSHQWLYQKYKGNTNAFANEYISIRRAFDNFEYFGLFGGAIFVDDNLVAYTVGERLTQDTALVHIEKADIKYAGSFATINYEFSNVLNKSFKYINREEDMGIIGLRKSKMSYKPIFLTDKYKCIITEV